MRISTIPQIYRNVGRWREILAILSKYGLADWLSRYDYLPLRSLLKNRSGQPLADESRSTRMRLAIEELGPTFIKLGQVLSTRPDVVGIELASELEKLQIAVPADPPEAVVALLEDELGQSVIEVFSEFCPEAVASASIGQVHRARLATGEEVAVKVQHADLHRRVRVDLDILAGLAQLAERLPELHPYRPCAVVAEFRRSLRRELDFERERRHVEELRRNLAENPTIRIPRPFAEYSTERVLVMEWLEGPTLANVERLPRDPDELAALARHGAELYLEMIFRHGFYHADPHPGNLVALPGGVLGLLDFGMVGRIDDALREDIEDLLAAVVEQDSQQLTAVVMRIAATPPGLNESALGIDLADFVAHYAHQQADKFELAAALTEMLDVMRRHQIVLPTAATMLLKVLVMLEGAGRRLSPRFSLMDVLRPYRKQMLKRRMSPMRQFRKARRIAYEMEQLAEVFPRRIRDILQQVQTGRFDVHLDHRGLEPSVNRLVAGLITSALFLGSVLMVVNHVWPLWFWPVKDVSAPGLAGLGVSLMFGLRLWRAISKSGHLDRRG
ncbi:MAG: AarF/ABC1/UbiB kinase family protein [Pirellulales bacterium]|nr:AarF/ABC1/UbiB kinase family protein [Pirellulales bacterium]